MPAPMANTPAQGKRQRGTIASRYLESISCGANDVSTLSMSSGGLRKTPERRDPRSKAYATPTNSSTKASLNDSSFGMTAPTALMDSSASWTTMETRSRSETRSTTSSRPSSRGAASLGRQIRSASAACSNPPQTALEDVDCSSIDSTSSHRRRAAHMSLDMDKEENFLQGTLEQVGRSIKSTKLPSPSSVMQQFRECRAPDPTDGKKIRKSVSPSHRRRSPYPRTSPRTPQTMSFSRRLANARQTGSLAPYQMRRAGTLEGSPSPGRPTLSAKERWQSPARDYDDEEPALSDAGAPTEIMTNRTEDVLFRNPSAPPMPPAVKRTAWLPAPYVDDTNRHHSLIDATSTNEDSSQDTDSKKDTGLQLRSLLDAQSSSMSQSTSPDLKFMGEVLLATPEVSAPAKGALDMHVQKTSPDRDLLQQPQYSQDYESLNTGNSSLRAEVGGNRVGNFMQGLKEESAVLNALKENWIQQTPSTRTTRQGTTPGEQQSRPMPSKSPVRYFLEGEVQPAPSKSPARYFMGEESPTAQPRTPKLVNSDEMTSSLSTTDALLSGGGKDRQQAVEKFVRYNERNAPNVSEVFQRRDSASSDNSSISTANQNADSNPQNTREGRGGDSKSPIQPLFSLDRLDFSYDAQSPIRRHHSSSQVPGPAAPPPTVTTGQGGLGQTSRPNHTGKAEFFPVAQSSSSLDTVDTEDLLQRLTDPPQTAEWHEFGRKSSTSTGLESELVAIMDQKIRREHNAQGHPSGHNQQEQHKQQMHQPQQHHIVNHHSQPVRNHLTGYTNKFSSKKPRSRINYAQMARHRGTTSQKAAPDSSSARRWESQPEAAGSRVSSSAAEEKKDDRSVELSRSPDIFDGIDDDDTASVKSLRERFERQENRTDPEGNRRENASHFDYDEDDASVKSLRERLEQRILAHEYLNENEDDDDDDGSVRSLRERFEPPKTKNRGAKVTHLRALFESSQPQHPLAKKRQSKDISRGTLASRSSSASPPSHEVFVEDWPREETSQEMSSEGNGNTAFGNQEQEYMALQSIDAPQVAQVATKKFSPGTLANQRGDHTGVATDNRHSQSHAHSKKSTPRGNSRGQTATKPALESGGKGSISKRYGSQSFSSTRAERSSYDDVDETVSAAGSQVKGPAPSPFLAMKERLLNFAESHKPESESTGPAPTKGPTKRSPPSMHERLNQWANRQQKEGTKKHESARAEGYPKTIEAKSGVVARVGSTDLSSVTNEKELLKAPEASETPARTNTPSFFTRTNNSARRNMSSLAPQPDRHQSSSPLDARLSRGVTNTNGPGKESGRNEDAKPPGSHWMDSSSKPHLKRNDSRGRSTDTENTDGVTLDASIAEVSHLTDPSAIRSHGSKDEGFYRTHGSSAEKTNESVQSIAEAPENSFHAELSRTRNAMELGNRQINVGTVSAFTPTESGVSPKDSAPASHGAPQASADSSALEKGADEVEWPSYDDKDWPTTNPEERRYEDNGSNANFDPVTTQTAQLPDKPIGSYAVRKGNRGETPAYELPAGIPVKVTSYEDNGRTDAMADGKALSPSPSPYDKDYDAIMGSRHQMLLSRQRAHRRRRAAREQHDTLHHGPSDAPGREESLGPSEPPGSRMSDIQSDVSELERATAADVTGFFGRTHPQRPFSPSLYKKYNQKKKPSPRPVQLVQGDYGPIREKRAPSSENGSNDIKTATTEPATAAASVLSRISETIGIGSKAPTKTRHEILVARLKSVKAARLRRAKNRSSRDYTEDKLKNKTSAQPPAQPVSYRMRQIQTSQPVAAADLGASSSRYYSAM